MSYWAHCFDIDDLEIKIRRYNSNLVYRQSNQANRTLLTVFAKSFSALGVAVNTCHADDAHSNLIHTLGFSGH